MKWFIYFVVLLASISLTLADDNESSSSFLIGDSELYLGHFGDMELNNLYYAPIGTPSVVGGNGGGTFHGVYYDVIINKVNLFYFQNDRMAPEFVIINKGDTPDKDAVLTYWLQTPKGTILYKTREVFEEVPQICSNGDYDRYKDVCVYTNGTEYAPFKVVLEREFLLTSEIGEYKIFVTYEAENTIDVYKSFTVVPKDWFKLLLIMASIVLLIIILFIVLFRRKKKEAQEINIFGS